MKNLKKTFGVLICMTVLFCLCIISASAASVSVSGPSSAQSGATVVYSVIVSDSAGLTGFSANIGTDDGMTVTSVSGCPSGWLSTSNNNKIVVAGANSVKSIQVSIKCTITGGTGESKRIYLSNVNTTDANNTDASGASTSSNAVSIAAPPSSDATLKSLTVGNAKISPAFSTGTTSYSCGTVGFEVSKLSVNAKANDSGAKVSINGTNLAVGENKVTVVVVAANGTKKTYTISVTREQDPNYVPSSNTSLSGITLSAGQLSPAFEAGLHEYVVYVPFETETISITPAAADPLAKGVESITDKALEVGKNELSVKCTAENGTEAVYKFYVIRMSKFEGISSLVTPLSKAEVPTTAVSDASKDKTSGLNSVSPVLLVVMSVACLVLGVAISAVILRNKYSREMRKALISSEALNPDDELDIELPNQTLEDDNDKYLE